MDAETARLALAFLARTQFQGAGYPAVSRVLEALPPS
jgi:hypothetical protein